MTEALKSVMGNYYFEAIWYFGERETWVRIPALPLRRQVALVLLLKACPSVS